jgi:hypothetical protein
MKRLKRWIGAGVVVAAIVVPAGFIRVVGWRTWFGCVAAPWSEIQRIEEFQDHPFFAVAPHGGRLIREGVLQHPAVTPVWPSSWVAASPP